MDARGWARYDAASATLRLALYVQPNARHSAVSGLHGEALKVRVAAPATDNRANAALIDFLSRAIGVAPSACTLTHGARGRRKTVTVRGVSPAVAQNVYALAG
jgi:uncharacterized protein (TIGR00251 family)